MFAADVSIDPGGILLGLAAVLTALVALRRRKTDNLIRQELRPNGGGSMKDQSTFAVLQMDRMSNQLAQVEAVQGATFDVLDSINTKNHDEHTEIWKALAVLGIDRRQPPADPGNGAT